MHVELDHKVTYHPADGDPAEATVTCVHDQTIVDLDVDGVRKPNVPFIEPGQNPTPGCEYADHARAARKSSAKHLAHEAVEDDDAPKRKR